MLQNALDILRKEGKEILVCLSGSEEAQRAWLAAGGEAGHMLSHRQVERICFPLSQDKRRGQ